MKKLIVKHKIIIIPYYPAIEAISEKWIKDGVEVFEQPFKEVTTIIPEKWIKDDEEVLEEPLELEGWEHIPASEMTQMEVDLDWEYIPGKPAKEEQLEESQMVIVGQTQGSLEDVITWLEGDVHKYDDEDVVTIEDHSSEELYKQCIENRKKEYPTPEEFLNAYFDNQETIYVMSQKRLEVKAKYPKPELKAPVIESTFQIKDFGFNKNISHFVD